MKRILLMIGMAPLLFTSCTKCTVCTQSQGSDVRVCEKDYNTNAEYGAAVDFYETAGYNCYKSW